MIEHVTLAIKDHFVATRLRALKDSPLAFGSTYAKESKFREADWIERINKWTNERSAALLAFDGESPCGIAAGYLEADDPGSANLVSMWVAPSHRRAGVGAMLVNGIIDWATRRGATTIRLMVTSSNLAAIRFYERLNFAKTGRTEPYPNDPALVEFEMERRLGSPG